MRTYIQRLGKSMMGPLSIIVASGLLLGIVTILTNPSIVGETIASAPTLKIFIDGVEAIVSAMFDMLPVLFAISVATGMADEDKEIAAFASIIGFILFHVTISYILESRGVTAETTSVEYLVEQGLSNINAVEVSNAYESILGIFTYRMGVLGGIIVGLWTAFIHNKFHTAELPVALSFFSGNRFVPIVIVATMPFIAIFSAIIWPFLNFVINGLGNIISNSGALGTFIYGFSERLLIPTGLHHVLNQLIRFTPIGGTATVDGTTVSGALSIFNAELAAQKMNLDNMRMATRFLTQGYHPFMLFGLPAACYAMYQTAYPEQKNKIKGMLLAAALTSFTTGITEPIEFAFIFISPILWIFHAFMAGLSFLIMTLLKVAIGNAGGGMIDLTIFGILQGTYTRWYLVIIIGIIYAIIYYFVFKYVIEKYDIKTPGRSDDLATETVSETETSMKKDKNTTANNSLGVQILEAIGGRENVVSVDNCISRLRLVLEDTSVVEERKLEETGSMGVVKIDDNNIQIVYGGKVERAAQALKKEI